MPRRRSLTRMTSAEYQLAALGRSDAATSKLLSGPASSSSKTPRTPSARSIASYSLISGGATGLAPLQDWPRKSGYQTFDALRFWSLWPPRFASARKSRWGSMVPRGVVGQSKSRILFADDSPARTRPCFEGQAAPLSLSVFTASARSLPSLMYSIDEDRADIGGRLTKCLLADISAPRSRNGEVSMRSLGGDEPRTRR